MEPALRIFSWGELLRLCGASASWADAGFRARFLAALYLHALFTERYIERSDVNGNHFTADAAALVLAGALFGTGRDAGRWLTAGLADLEHEILVQVHPDGVDFEASTAYHRLVAELFLAASMAGAACGCATSAPYRQRLAAMARFTSVYMRPDSTAPLWGDHDDARVLPLGPQGIRDHRYLVGLIGLHLGDAELLALAGGPRAEGCWWFGPGAAARLTESAAPVASAAFRAGGVYVMRGARDHVFIDCGPLGLADRGGHGHNDLLSFEAFLDGVPVVTEGGCYVYTADFASRNRDRATRSHNTPLVDGAEINRFVAPEQLWTLTADAGFEAGEFTVTPGRVRFRGSHSGYRRLPGPVSVMRTIDYDATTAELIVSDRLEGEGVHEVEIPLHLEPGIALRACGERALELKAGPTSFELSWSGAGFSLAQEESRVATSYGVARVGPLLVWRASGALPLELRVAIARATVVSTARAGAAP